MGGIRNLQRRGLRQIYKGEDSEIYKVRTQIEIYKVRTNTEINKQKEYYT